MDATEPGAAPVTRAQPRGIAFEVNARRFAFEVKAPGQASIPSVFLVGLPKAGSTLLNRLMKPVATFAGLAFVAVQEIMFDMGVPAQEIPARVNEAFEPRGYVFGGFRSLPGGLALPPYASDRTIVLVRDPRDMLTSLYFSLARSHNPPGQAIGADMAARFREKREEIRRMDIDEFVLENAGAAIRQYETVENKLSTVRHKLYRYEDVIFDKRAWLEDMVAYLNLSAPAPLLSQVVASNDVRPDVEDADRHIRKVVPGDHVEKLRTDTIVALDKRFAPILRRYHYA